MSALVIAANTYREAIRRKTLIAFLLFALLTIASSIFLTVFSPGEEVKIVKDVCLTGISFFSMLITVFVTGAMLPTETENRVIYTVISKPLRRTTYLFGKFIGAQALIILNLVLMTALFVVILWTQEQRFSAADSLVETESAPFMLQAILVGKASVLVYCELGILSSLTLAASTQATSATLPVILGVFIYLVGHLTNQLKAISAYGGSNEFVAALAQTAYNVMPNLNVFYLRNNLVHNDPYVPQGMLWLMLYAGSYVAFGLALSYVLFRRREM